MASTKACRILECFFNFLPFGSAVPVGRRPRAATAKIRSRDVGHGLAGWKQSFVEQEQRMKAIGHASWVNSLHGSPSGTTVHLRILSVGSLDRCVVLGTGVNRQPWQGIVGMKFCMFVACHPFSAAKIAHTAATLNEKLRPIVRIRANPSSGLTEGTAAEKLRYLTRSFNADRLHPCSKR